jgi:subtilisin family serine protease
MTNQTRSCLLASAVLVLLSACAAAPAQPPVNAMPDAVRMAPERHFVVTVRDATRRRPTSGYRRNPGSAARAAAASIADDYGLEEAASWPIGLLGVHCIVYAVPPAADPRELLARISADRRVESAQPLVTFETQSSDSYNDPYARLQNSLALLNVPQAQQWSRGSGVRVAIVDTGVDTAHPDLQLRRHRRRGVRRRRARHGRGRRDRRGRQQRHRHRGHRPGRAAARLQGVLARPGTVRHRRLQQLHARAVDRRRD